MTGPRRESPRSVEMGDRNFDVVRKWVEAANRQDWDGMVELYAEEGTYTSPRGVVAGREAIRVAFRGLFDVLPDLDTEVTNMFGSGDSVAIEIIARGTTAKPWPAVPGSVAGKKMENNGVHVFRFRDGRIVSDRSYYDSGAIARQLAGTQPGG
jgi:steroid delta-isomerase-like uncharacterized protein